MFVSTLCKIIGNFPTGFNWLHFYPICKKINFLLTLDLYVSWKSIFTPIFPGLSILITTSKYRLFQLWWILLAQIWPFFSFFLHKWLYNGIVQYCVKYWANLSNISVSKSRKTNFGSFSSDSFALFLPLTLLNHY